MLPRDSGTRGVLRRFVVLTPQAGHVFEWLEGHEILVPIPKFTTFGSFTTTLQTCGSRFSQLLYHGQTLVVQKLTESKFGIPKFGIPIEIWSLMSRIGCILKKLSQVLLDFRFISVSKKNF